MDEGAPPLMLGVVAFRAINSLAVRTYFNPDEYWQGPEIAHWLVFRRGHL
jgi:GPI mannosyltransferase 3